MSRFIAERPNPIKLRWARDPVAVVFDRDNAQNFWSWEGDEPCCYDVSDVAALRELDAALDEFTATVRGLIHAKIAELKPKPKTVVDQLAEAIAEGKAIAEKIAALTAKAGTP